jgi:phosphonate transport system permease protein
VLVVASFWSLDLQWAQFPVAGRGAQHGPFLGEFFPPDTVAPSCARWLVGTWETLAMSALGTLLAAVAGLALALPASRLHAGDAAPGPCAHARCC